MIQVNEFLIDRVPVGTDSYYHRAREKFLYSSVPITLLITYCSLFQCSYRYIIIYLPRGK